MLESTVEFLSQVPWGWVLLIAFLFTFLENIFPPAPCDTIIVFTGSLVSLKVVTFVPLLTVATIGSIVGFTLMFWLGRVFGRKVVGSPKFKFITEEKLAKSDEWIQRYGYWIIVLNRFLSGTRGVISFFAGMSKMRYPLTISLASASALVWNFVLIYVGMLLGWNWRLADKYLSLYEKIFIPLIIAIILFFFIRWMIKRKRKISSK